MPPKPWEEHARRWLCVEDLAPPHAVGQRDMAKMVVLEGAEYWACVRMEWAVLAWVVVTASRLVWQRSRGPACYGVLRDHLRFLGPIHRMRRCSAESIPQAPAVFVEVMKNNEILIETQK